MIESLMSTQELREVRAMLKNLYRRLTLATLGHMPFCPCNVCKARKRTAETMATFQERNIE